MRMSIDLRNLSAAIAEFPESEILLNWQETSEKTSEKNFLRNLNAAIVKPHDIWTLRKFPQIEVVHISLGSKMVSKLDKVRL